MDQTTARRLAREVGGIATQDSRLHGRFAKPGEPWVVALPSGGTLTEVPGEESCTCLPYPYGDGPEVDCPVHGACDACWHTVHDDADSGCGYPLPSGLFGSDGMPVMRPCRCTGSLPAPEALTAVTPDPWLDPDAAAAATPPPF